MDETRLDKMEEMLANLITMVGSMNQKLQDSIDEQAKFAENQNMMHQELKSLKKEQQEMKKEQQEMKKEQQEMKKEQQEMKKEQQEMHEELFVMKNESEKQSSAIINKLTYMQADQDHIWEKATKNERELAKYKVHLQF